MQPTGLVRADCRRPWSPMTSLYRISHSLLFRIRTRHSVASHNRLNRIHPSCSHASLTRGAHLLPSHSPSSTHHAHSCWPCCPSRLALLAFRSHENSLPRFSAITSASAYSRPIFTSLFTAAYPSRLFTPVSQVCWVGSCRPDLSSLSRCLYVRAVSHPASHALRA